jgi:hypothetical protein
MHICMPKKLLCIFILALPSFFDAEIIYMNSQPTGKHSFRGNLRYSDRKNIFYNKIMFGEWVF